MIIDPSRKLAMELKPLFNALRYTVSFLQDMSDVANALGHRRFEVALFNVTGAATDWRDTLAELKRATVTTTFIALGLSADESELRGALGAGAFATLDRPISKAQLEILISSNNDGLFVHMRG